MFDFIQLKMIKSFCNFFHNSSFLDKKSNFTGKGGSMFDIVRKEVLSESVNLFEISAPDIAKKAQAGQFFVFRLHEEGERIPVTFADFNRDKGTIITVVQEVGKSTMELGTFKEGDSIANIIGPLGNPSEIENFGKVLCVGGGIGIAAVYPIARQLKNVGNEIVSLIGARTKDLIVFEEKMREISDEFIVTTDDGSYGREGVVTIPLKEILEKDNSIKRVIAIGPPIMMKFAAKTTEPFRVKTIVSLNSIMVDATGMCGACRVEVGGETRFACVHGPEFDGHQVNFDLLLSRLNMYTEEEKKAISHYQEKCGGDG